MAKQTRNKVEQALYDIKKARQMIKKAAENLESSIDSRENRIRFLEEETRSDIEWINQIKENYETKFQEIFGKRIDTYLDGFRFERHVVWWMNQYYSQYELKIWQGDKCYKPYEDSKMIRASWNSYPDLIYVDTNEKKVLALECKYRANGIIWLDDEHFKNYETFEKQIGNFMNVDTEVYVMVGTSGPSSERPDCMYCVPLSCLRNQREMDLCNYPQYRVMDRSEQMCITENIPF